MINERSYLFDRYYPGIFLLFRTSTIRLAIFENFNDHNHHKRGKIRAHYYYFKYSLDFVCICKKN